MTVDPKPLMTATGRFYKRILKKAVYVDKTNFLAKMILSEDIVWFLSRPRRFGKTLTISTIKSLFSGNRQLFQGLAIESHLDDELFSPRPVLHLDMSNIFMSGDILGFKSSLKSYMLEVAGQLGITIDPNLPANHILRILIQRLGKDSEHGVAILIDEYDAPLVAFRNKPELENLCETMRDFYNSLKTMEDDISFIFVTGITKATHMGLLSVFNTYRDISSNPEYGAIVGFTQEELEHYFAYHIKQTANKLKMSKTELLLKLKTFYNGFCFDGITSLYNPFSTLQFFADKQFKEYWFKSGTSSILTKVLRKNNLTVEDIRGYNVTMDFADNPGDYTESKPVSFLYQSGYLSLRPGPDDDSYSLDYPNREVLHAMSKLLISSYVTEKEADHLFFNVRKALDTRDVPELIKHFNLCLAFIPYEDYNKAKNNQHSEPSEQSNHETGEHIYRSNLLTLLHAIGIDVLAKSHGSIGRSDILIRHKGIFWVIDLKVKKEHGDSEKKLLNRAIKQITENQYSVAFPDPVRLAIVINNKKRAISLWKSF